MALRALDTDPTCNQFGVPTAKLNSSIGQVQGIARQFGPRDDGSDVLCWAGLGQDGLLRVVVAEFDANTPTSPAAIDDLIPRLYFNDAPPA